MNRFTGFLTSALIALCATLSLSAQESKQLSANITLGPYLQAVTEDGFTVVWMTDVDACSWVEIAPDDGTHFYACERPQYYETIAGKRPVGKLHKVRIEGLEKGTTYRYRVMQQALITEVGQKKVCFGIPSGNDPFRQKPYTVTTLDHDAECLKFAIINDIHGKDSIFRALTQNLVADQMDMIFFNGDMLSAMDNQEQLLKGYLRSACELFGANLPFYHARGNHESRGWFSYRYLDFFPTSTGETYYMLRQGPAAILVLDCGEDKPDSDISYHGLICNDDYREKEAKWLAEVIKSDDFVNAPVKICICHMPSSNGGWHGNKEINRLFIPLLEEAGVDLMLSGHIHKYNFAEVGERNCNFPVIINGCEEKHYFIITKDSIKAQRIDKTGKILREYDFPISK